MDILSKFITPGLLFLLTLILGIWLNRVGNPYPPIIFNIHKLVALAVVILATIQLIRLPRAGEAQTAFILLLVLAGACVVALFATGAFLSAGKFNDAQMRAVHTGASVVLLVAAAALGYLLAQG